MSIDDPERIYREFNVIRRGFMKYEPVFIVMENGSPRTYRTYIYFWTKLTAMEVSMLMQTSYNDGLYSGEINTFLAEKTDE